VLRGHGHAVQHGVVVGFGLGRRNVAYGFEQPLAVEPVDPLQCGELDGLQAPPRSATMDHFGFVEAVDHGSVKNLGQVACSSGSDRPG